MASDGSNKGKIITELNEVVGSFVFKDRLPQTPKIDKTKLNALALQFDKKIINGNIVKQVLDDLAFKEVLDKVNSKDEKYKGEIELKNIKEIDTNDIASKAYEFLNDLPKDYLFILRLPKCDTSIKNIRLASNIEILSADDALISLLYPKQDPEMGLRSLLSGHAPSSRLTKGDVILKVRGTGYMSGYGSIKLSIIDPLYIWKVIIGVYAGLEIIQRQDKITYFGLQAEFTYNAYLLSGERVRSFSESTEDNQYVSRIKFKPTIFAPTSLDVLLKKTNTPFDYANEVLTNLLSEIRFAHGKTDKNVMKQQRMIKNGAYWFYESLKTQQDHIRAIYMTTAFDSLLGVKGNEDTKENKAEIIAVSVSTDSLEAHSVRQAIIELYALRNEIIHGSREISSLDQYGDLDEKPSPANLYYSLSILTRFLKSRIFFINGGLARVSKFTKLV